MGGSGNFTYVWDFRGRNDFYRRKPEARVQ